MTPILPPGYSLRSPIVDDIPAILALLTAHDLAATGEADTYTAEGLLIEWDDLDITQDAWVIVAGDQTIAAYATLTTDDDGRLIADGYVHPEYNGRGLGTAIIAQMEARAAAMVAHAPISAHQVLVNSVVGSDRHACALLEGHGYTLTRAYFRMHITLSAPPMPHWPAGITLRTCDGSQTDIYHAYATIEEGFQDHWAHAPVSFADWQRYMVRHDFDPSLWFFAQEGEVMVGAILTHVRAEGQGWIEQLAVRRPWRQRGIGMALLQQAFAALYARGATRVGLGVDGQSLTGAQHLYEQAGMTVTMRIARYEKTLAVEENPFRK